MNKEQETVLEVEGMSCPSCIRHVTAALKDSAGVGSVDVKLREGLVVVRHDATQAPIATLIDALEGAGYGSKPRAA